MNTRDPKGTPPFGNPLPKRLCRRCNRKLPEEYFTWNDVYCRRCRRAYNQEYKQRVHQSAKKAKPR